MPKKGMTGITLKNEVAELLRKRAQAADQGLNEFLSSLLLGPSLNHHEDSPGTVPIPVTTNILTPVSTSFLGEASFAKEGSHRPSEPENEGSNPSGPARTFSAEKLHQNVGALLSWPRTREDFLQYIQFKKYDPENAVGMLSYLDRFVKVIETPMDVMRIFSTLSVGQQHHLNRAMRAWFRCLEISLEAPEDWLDVLRKAIPKDETGVDINIPGEEQIIRDLKRLPEIDLRYRVIYDVLLDSGLRLIEAVQLVNGFSGKRVEKFEGFGCIEMGLFRKTKQAYFAFLSDHTLELLRRLKEEVKERSATKYYQNHKLTNPKYLRKFVFDTQTDVKLNIPESVADFIEGRVPKKVGARHYMKLKRKAARFYPRYARYVAELRQTAGV